MVDLRKDKQFAHERKHLIHNRSKRSLIPRHPPQVNKAKNCSAPQDEQIQRYEIT